MDGAHERMTRQSCDELPVALRRLGLRCPMMHRRCDAMAPLRTDRPGHAHTQPCAGRPGRARSGRASGKQQQRAPSRRRPCRGPGATCHPWRQGGLPSGGGHRASGVTPPRLAACGVAQAHGFPDWRARGEAEESRLPGKWIEREDMLGPIRSHDRLAELLAGRPRSGAERASPLGLRRLSMNESGMTVSATVARWQVAFEDLASRSTGVVDAHASIRGGRGGSRWSMGLTQANHWSHE